MEERTLSDVAEPVAGGGLRERALQLWREKREYEESHVEERIAEEERVLRGKLVELGARADEVLIKHKGGRLIAETEGLCFISAYSDPWLTTLSVTRTSNLPGVMLLWRCPACGREVQGGLIRNLINLGEELECIEAGESHRCGGGAGR